MAFADRLGSAPRGSTQTPQLFYIDDINYNIWTKSMQNLPVLQDAGNQQVYGFLCQKTNVFYAFESFEAYQEFLEWLERENMNGTCDMQPEESPSFAPLNDTERLTDFQMATKEIMSVFEDPMLYEQDRQILMEEIDF